MNTFLISILVSVILPMDFQGNAAGDRYGLFFAKNDKTQVNTWEAFVEFLAEGMDADPLMNEEMSQIGYSHDLPLKWVTLNSNGQIGIHGQYYRGMLVLASIMECTDNTKTAQCYHFVVNPQGDLVRVVSASGSDENGWAVVSIPLNDTLTRNFNKLKTRFITARRDYSRR